MRPFLASLMSLVLAVLLPTATLGQTPGADHYLCYKASQAKGETKFVAASKLLVDRFQNQSFDVKKSTALCNPATKTYGGTTESPAFESVHLQGYKIKLPKGAEKFVERDFLMSDQFGRLELSVKKPDSLLVRAGKKVLGTALAKCRDDSECPQNNKDCVGGVCVDPRFPDAPADDIGVDNFKCYKVAVAKGAPKFAPIKGGLVEVTDQFGGPLKVEIKKPTKLCLPVDKENENPGAETHVDHLMCYRAKLTKTDPAQSKFEKTRVAVSNTNFPDTRLDAKSMAELCVPARQGRADGCPIDDECSTWTPDGNGGCIHTNHLVQTPCFVDTCVDGKIEIALRDCGESNDCWTTQCHAFDGCVATPGPFYDTPVCDASCIVSNDCLGIEPDQCHTAFCDLNFCKVVLDCDDGDPCTRDFCEDGGCGHEPTCASDDPCALVTCDSSTGECSAQQICSGP